MQRMHRARSFLWVILLRDFLPDGGALHPWRRARSGAAIGGVPGAGLIGALAAVPLFFWLGSVWRTMRMSRTTTPPTTAHATAKAAVVRLTQCLGPLAEEGIRVNCVAPDWTATERVLERFDRDEARDGFGRPPPERLLEPAEVADAVRDLIRDESLAGRTLVLRGGEPSHFLPDDRWE